MKNIDEYKKIYATIKTHLNIISIHDEDDDNLSNEEYFKRGIHSDILMNAESIAINIIKDNGNSQGIDSSARAIMESFLILDMDKKGKIEPEQKKLYKLSRYPVEYYNYKRIFDGMHRNEDPTFSQNEDMQLREKKIKEFCKCASEFHGVKIKKNNINIGVSNFYLRERGNYNKPINYANDLIYKYYTGIGAKNKKYQEYMYHFFSQMVHPWCEENELYLKAIMKERNHLVDVVLNRVIQFVNKEMSPVETTCSFDNDYEENCSNFDVFLNNIQTLYDFIGPKIATAYSISTFFFERICFLTKDIFLLHQLGNYEMEITKFKCYAEMVSVASFLVKLKTKKERKYRTKGFCLSSRLRLIASREPNIQINKLKSNFLNTYIDLRTVFYDFYQNKYSFKPSNHLSQRFVNKMDSKGFYPLDKKAMQINPFIRKELNRCSKKYGFAQDFNDVYTVSLNLEHGVGLCYNSSTMVNRFNALLTCEIPMGILKMFCSLLDAQIENFDAFINEFVSECLSYRRQDINLSYDLMHLDRPSPNLDIKLGIDNYLLSND